MLKFYLPSFCFPHFLLELVRTFYFQGAEDKQEDVLEALSKSFQEENERQHGLLLNDMWKNFDANGNLNVLTNNDMLTANDDEYQEKSETKEDRKKDKRKIHFQVPESEVIGPPTGTC